MLRSTPGHVTGHPRELCLFVRAGKQLCAVPVEHVDETMRPQVVQTLIGAPPFVRGMAVIRGAPTPVVDAAAVIGGQASHPTRFVILRTADRRVALAVDGVLGVGRIDPETVSTLPPLLARANVGVVKAIATLDAELLMVLETGKLVPDAAVAAIEPGPRT